MKSLYIIIICFIFSLSSYGYHPEIDSLKAELKTTKVDTIRVRLLNEIAFEFIDVSYDSILPYAQKALNLSNKIKFPKGKGIALKNQSIYYFYAGDQTESREKMEEAILIFKKIQSDLLVAKAYQSYGVLLKSYGATDKAIEKYQRAIHYFRKIKNETGTADNLINLGNVYQNQGDFDKALQVFSEARGINENLKDLRIKASILSGEGLIAEKKGEFDRAVKKLSESLELFKELEVPRMVLGMYNNLANIARKQGNYLKSIEYFENALITAEDINNPRLQGIILNNLANSYLDINDDDKAASLYRQAIDLIKGIDKSTYASLLSNLAIIQTNKKQYDKALKSLDSALTIYRDQGNKIYVANTLSNIANNHLKLENISEAKNFYKEAKLIAEEMDDKYTCTSIYNGLGEVCLKEKKLDSAYFYAKKAYAISKEIEALPEEYAASELLYNISKSKGDASEALKHIEIFTKLKDSLFDEEKSKALGKLEAELGFKSLKEQMELEKEKQNLENEFKVGQRENFIIGLSISSIALILVVILLLYIKKNKSRTNHLLNLKNKEIETQNIKLRESNLQKNKLFSIISHDLRSPVNSLSQIFDMYVSGQVSEEEFKEWVPEINKNITSTRLLIDNLLKWASESLHESQVNKTEFFVREEIENMEDFFNSALKEKNLILNNKVSKQFTMYMDANAFKLVIRNIISNAIKFCNSGDEISISATTQDDFNRICIQDTGVGMDQDKARMLFTNSSIISSIGTQNEDGKGIGTMLCRTYVEENGGLIWVDYSEENSGTRICFEVPVKSDFI
ncbi:tetratricopeptide repeat protein [Psychroflexus sediminis]|uniref:histidine kinase n=1 Tax=Psychroflexus sediminis TaxID=470826 RepID=A0A1G7UK45_9FLAO|nr:tetratricopeptide repeat protein [Psychroflexus sediminis]SDG47728.1 Tetratricopeptide repeat-containing protein [Psychroflexus sediminis]